jgi:hypothetical protein
VTITWRTDTKQTSAYYHCDVDGLFEENIEQERHQNKFLFVQKKNCLILNTPHCKKKFDLLKNVQIIYLNIF